MLAALVAQIATLLFHQTTTNVDLYPFNNIRGYTRRERTVEAAVNGAVMLLPQVRDHPTPNLEHTLLHALTGLAAVLTWLHALG